MQYDEHGIPILGPAPEDKNAEDREDRKAERTYQYQQTTLQKRMLWTQIAIVVFGSVGAGVSLWQANNAQETTDISQKSVSIAQRLLRQERLLADRQLAESQASNVQQIALAEQNMRDSAHLAQSASNAAAKTLKAQQRTFEIDQRPYIVPETPGFIHDLASGQPVIANIAFKNVGKSTAKSKLIAIKMIRYDSTIYGRGTENINRVLTNQFHLIDVSLQEQAMALSGYQWSSDAAPNAEFYASGEPIALTPDEARRMSKGENIDLFLFGKITYSDAFKHSYSTTFCYYFFGSNAAQWNIEHGFNNIE